MERVLITGASRGIGLEFTRQYLERGARVFAGCRTPDTAQPTQALRQTYGDRLTIVPLDVAEEDSIRVAAASVGTQVDGLEILVNNAGIGGVDSTTGEHERLGTFHIEDAVRVFRTMSIGPLLLAQECLDLLRQADHGKIANVTSGYGSISHNNGFPYYYSAAKAAMHQFMRSLAADVKEWGISTVLLDPGWVRTDMGGPNAPLSPEESVSGMMKVIDALTVGQSGSFLGWQGDTRPW